MFMKNEVKHNFKRFLRALADVTQWTEGQPVNQSVAHSIPSQPICLGWGPGPQWGGCERQLQIDISLPPFVPPFPSLYK